jgi:type IV pilus assembly protein PilQ
MKIIYKTAGRKINLFILISLLLFMITGDMPAQEVRSISMDFQQAALKDVLKVFSQQAGLNFVADEKIENKMITLYLDNVAVKDALDSIMSANNLAYEQAHGSAVFIVKDSGKAKIDMTTKVYPLDFARISGAKEGATSEVTDIKQVIEHLLSKDPETGEALGGIVVDKRTNSIIVTATPSNFVIIEETIKKLDSVTPQALIEAEIVEIQTGALKSLGLEWGSSDGTFVRFTGPKKLTHFPFVRHNNPLSRGLLKINTSSGSEDEQQGLLGELSLQEFSLVIKALESDSMARYLAKPRIMCLSNETAEIKITADTAVSPRAIAQESTGTITTEYDRMETGVSLKVTPTVNSKGYITMTIEPEVSRAVLSALFTDAYDPAKRSAKTTVMVKDGQTIAIGGLLKTDEEDTGRSVPGLSRIPLFGNLFRTKGKQSVQTEIIVFITAHAILEADDAIQTVKSIKDSEMESRATQTVQAEHREAEIQKTVMRLRKKRELERSR